MQRSKDELTFGFARWVELCPEPGNEVRRLFTEPDLDVRYLLVDDDDAAATGAAAIVSIDEVCANGNTVEAHSSSVARSFAEFQALASYAYKLWGPGRTIEAGEHTGDLDLHIQRPTTREPRPREPPTARAPAPLLSLLVPLQHHPMRGRWPRF